MGNTSLTGGPIHALERCYLERTATEVPRRLPAELLPRKRASRTIQHLEEDSLPWPDHQGRQVDQPVPGDRPEGLSGALSSAPKLPVADGRGDRPGAGLAGINSQRARSHLVAVRSAKMIASLSIPEVSPGLRKLNWAKSITTYSGL